jgi:hypothetical protein
MLWDPDDRFPSAADRDRLDASWQALLRARRRSPVAGGELVAAPAVELQCCEDGYALPVLVYERVELVAELRTIVRNEWIHQHESV